MLAKKPKNGFSLEDIERVLQELHQEELCELIDELVVEDEDQDDKPSETSEREGGYGYIYITPEETKYGLSTRGKLTHSPRVKRALKGSGIVALAVAMYQFIQAHQEQLWSLGQTLFTKH